MSSRNFVQFTLISSLILHLTLFSSFDHVNGILNFFKGRTASSKGRTASLFKGRTASFKAEGSPPAGSPPAGSPPAGSPPAGSPPVSPLASTGFDYDPFVNYEPADFGGPFSCNELTKIYDPFANYEAADFGGPFSYNELSTELEDLYANYARRESPQSPDLRSSEGQISAAFDLTDQAHDRDKIWIDEDGHQHRRQYNAELKSYVERALIKPEDGDSWQDQYGRTLRWEWNWNIGDDGDYERVVKTELGTRVIPLTAKHKTILELLPTAFPEDAKPNKAILLPHGLVATSEYIEGDGNCQFRALAYCVKGSVNYHNVVRTEIVDWLELNIGLFEDVIYDPVAYLENMRTDKKWGDELTLQAASKIYPIKIFVLSLESHSGSYVTLFGEDADGEDQASRKVVGLVLNDQHYELLYKPVLGQ